MATIGDWAIRNDGRGALCDGENHWRGFRCLACMQDAGLCAPDRQRELEGEMLLAVADVQRWNAEPVFGCREPIKHMTLRRRREPVADTGWREERTISLADFLKTKEAAANAASWDTIPDHPFDVDGNLSNEDEH